MTLIDVLSVPTTYNLFIKSFAAPSLPTYPRSDIIFIPISVLGFHVFFLQFVNKEDISVFLVIYVILNKV